MLQIAAAYNTDSEKALMVYSDRYDEQGLHPTIDYQEGALRDDFDFGSLVLFRSADVKNFLKHRRGMQYTYAAMYALRLYVSAHGEIIHLKEPLYTELETDLRTSGQKQFDYVNPRNKVVQTEMERACTEHLKELVLGWLPTNTTNCRMTALATQLRQVSSYLCATGHEPLATPLTVY